MTYLSNIIRFMSAHLWWYQVLQISQEILLVATAFPHSPKGYLGVHD